MLFLNNRTLGATLLVIGTSIGAGMLGIPLATAKIGFKSTVILFSFVFLVMLYSAIAYAKVSLKFSKNTNLDTYLDKACNKYQKYFIKTINIVFLYALLSAYGQGMSQSILSLLNINSGFFIEIIPKVVFVTLSLFITFNTKAVDLTNRVMSLGLILSYCFMVYSFFSKDVFTINTSNNYSLKDLISCIPLLITSFGFHLSIPSIKDYLNEDENALIKSITMGLSITFLIYCVWIFVIFNSVDAQSTSDINSLFHIQNNYLLALAVSIFSLTAILSSFLGVGLGLKDFFFDITKNKLKIKKYTKSIAGVITFAPPIIFLTYSNTGFVQVLKFAGLFATFLLIILPIFLSIKFKVNIPFKRVMLSLSILLIFAA